MTPSNSTLVTNFISLLRHDGFIMFETPKSMKIQNVNQCCHSFVCSQIKCSLGLLPVNTCYYVALTSCCIVTEVFWHPKYSACCISPPGIIWHASAPSWFYTVCMLKPLKSTSRQEQQAKATSPHRHLCSLGYPPHFLVINRSLWEHLMDLPHHP